MNVTVTAPKPHALPAAGKPPLLKLEDNLETYSPGPIIEDEQLPARIQTPLLHKVACGAVIGSAAWLAANVVSQIAGAGGPVAVATAGAVALGAMAAGHSAADLTSGVFHHFIDNYPTPETPVIGGMAYQFQVHHHKIHDLETQTVWTNMASAGRFMWLPMAALAVMNPHYAVQAAAIGFFGGGFLAQGSHRWTHEHEPPRFAAVLQKLGIAQRRKSHAIHHKMPWADNYCIVNGAWNPLLTKTHFFRKWEKLIFQVTGKEPHCWKDPGVKAFALGEIGEEEFLKQQGMNRRIFANAVRGEFAEYEKKMGDA